MFCTAIIIAVTLLTFYFILRSQFTLFCIIFCFSCWPLVVEARRTQDAENGTYRTHHAPRPRPFMADAPRKWRSFHVSSFCDPSVSKVSVPVKYKVRSLTVNYRSAPFIFLASLCMRLGDQSPLASYQSAGCPSCQFAGCSEPTMPFRETFPHGWSVNCRSLESSLKLFFWVFLRCFSEVVCSILWGITLALGWFI